MSIFRLPDLGEGLPDAEIHEWLVKVGDVVKVDQPIVSMETAKAVVEVPSPQAGKIAKLNGKAGDIIKTGQPLVEFEGSERQDTGTVVGKIEDSGQVIEENFIIGSQAKASTGHVKATPAVRKLANELKVDLAKVKATGQNSVITADDVKQAAAHEIEGLELLRGTRRMMAINMANSHAEVVPVTIYDDVDIYQWSPEADITLRLIQALIAACKAEPALNASYNGKHVGRVLHQQVNVGLAMDTGDALFVPVIKAAESLKPAAIRERIETFKRGVKQRDIPQQDLQGATISLSNFGKFAGRYASPIIVPPTVAIVAVGSTREDVVAQQGKAVVHRVIPLSLTFDHRAVTGGEATRFLGMMMAELQKP